MKITQSKTWDRILFDGGATFDKDLNLVDFNKGYQVALNERNWVGVINTPSKLKTKLNEMSSRLKENEYLGFWRDPETGKTFVEPSVYVKHKLFAYLTGKLQKQKAIWDWGNSNSIEL